MSAEGPLFLLGLHRGGTTFVQRLLNCHRDVTIWGENGGFLSGLREAFEAERHDITDRAAFAEFSAYADRVTSWASPVDSEGFLHAVAVFVESIYATAPYWGFKEIRHGNFSDIDFLKRLFPSARLVLLRRRPRDVLRSTIHVAWSDLPSRQIESWVEAFVASVSTTFDAFATASARWPDVAEADYEHIRSQADVLGLFDRIGVDPQNVDLDLVEVVLHSRVNSSFVDVGRSVESAVEERVLAVYDRLVGAGPQSSGPPAT